MICGTPSNQLQCKMVAWVAWVRTISSANQVAALLLLDSYWLHLSQNNIIVLCPHGSYFENII